MEKCTNNTAYYNWLCIRMTGYGAEQWDQAFVHRRLCRCHVSRSVCFYNYFIDKYRSFSEYLSKRVEEVK